MLAMVVGHTTAGAETLRERISNQGVHCKASTTMSLDRALEELLAQRSHPDIIFLQCDGQLEVDGLAITQLRRVTQAEIAAVGSFQTPSDMLELIRSGANDYLADADEFQSDLHRLLVRLRRRSPSGNTRGRILSVLSASGGCGASSVAINLAAALRQKGHDPSLVELQYDGGSLEAMLDVHTDHTLADLCQRGAELDQEILAKSFAEHPSGLRLLASPPAHGYLQPPSSTEIERVLHLAAETSSHVLIDLQDAYHADQVAALLASDLIVFVLRIDLPCLLKTRRTLDALLQLGVEHDRLRLVANRQVKRSGLNESQVVAALGHPIAQSLPDDFPVAVTALNVGNPVVYESPRSHLARAYHALADSLLNQPNPTPSQLVDSTLVSVN